MSERTLYAFIVAALTLSGCGGLADRKPAAGSGPSEHRVVVMAPAGAEMLEELGFSDRVVGIGDFGPWPATIADRPAVGGYSAPNVERVLALGATLLVTAKSEAAGTAHQRLESLGVRVLALDTSTYDGIFTSIDDVGRVFGAEDEALALAESIREQVRALESRAAGLARRRVLFVVGRDPLYVAGPGSHIDALIQRAGGVNVVHDAQAPYQRVSMEAILERMPEVIIDTSDNRPGALRGREVGWWGRWEFLPAVRDGRVYWVDPSRLVIPGIRVPEMTRLMGRLIHPDEFGDPAPAEFLPE